jgi:G:T-mismatch repair DNA endonuclease (very short patch repair protein)
MKKLSAGGKNPFCRPEVVERIKQTKLERYGTSSYNNQEKMQTTMMQRYGVHSPFCLPVCRTNGKRISNIQRKVYNEVKAVHTDALLEHYLPDVKLCVDIFIPNTKQVIEVFGDYWHMNPSVYKKHDFNANTKLTAKETWKKDNQRIMQLQSAGYDVNVVWETPSQQIN